MLFETISVRVQSQQWYLEHTFKITIIITFLFLNVSDGEVYRRGLSLGPMSTKGKSEHDISN